MTTTTHEANPARSMLGGAMFLLLTAAPVIALLMIAAYDRNAEGPAELVRSLSSGVMTAGGGPVAVTAWIAGVLFSIWIIVTEHIRANRAPASHKRRWRTRFVDAGRTVMIVGGGGLLIYGGISLLYCLLVAIRPELVFERLPFSFLSSIPALAFGGACYAFGRLSR
jgi:hypothetical protein